MSTLAPREKLQLHGVSQLKTTELVALVLGTGTAQHSVTELANEVVERLQQHPLTLEKLTQVPGIGIAKACQLLAMIEFVERVRPIGFPVIDQLDKVTSLVPELRSAQREHIVVLYLNARLQLLLKETVAIGSVNQSIVSARDIFSVIKYHPVSSLILVHNHPSGVPLPSPEDFIFTQRIVQAAEVLGIEVLDHVIIAEKGCYSFKEHQQL
ncbi:DNA repair protein RadC [Patescibacteria group bacterium]|nr:DNA repair protein RadC [Patescibacteria group bacterium]